MFTRVRECKGYRGKRRASRGAVFTALMLFIMFQTMLRVEQVAGSESEGSPREQWDEGDMHGIVPTESYPTNPMKGFVPYAGEEECVFPHTMEWFNMPVNAVQIDNTTYDWTDFEKQLEAIAEKGDQAIFRFYYDYPSLPSGVPEYLLNQGLVMRAYDEPDLLGGEGLSPDYADEEFRLSMKHFIKALGEKYDGDPRIAAITVGLLGFWGEWHQWPYDEDTSDGREDWSISTEIYQEVLDAYDLAFDVTPLLVREPKDGVDFSRAKVGFHDDSFGYATLAEEDGGQAWSFLSKLDTVDLSKAWKKQMIGGELYPPDQLLVFEGDDWFSQSGQSLKTCIEESHVSWLLNDAISSYSGEALKRAISASSLMGYDFQVDKIYFKESVNANHFTVDLRIRNHGVAYFYDPGHLWRLELGLFSQGQRVESQIMDWTLTTFPPDGLDYSIKDEYFTKVDEGQYELKLRVINPNKNGKPLLFANQGQQEDGWLKLGELEIHPPKTIVKKDSRPKAPENAIPLSSIVIGGILCLSGILVIKIKLKKLFEDSK